MLVDGAKLNLFYGFWRCLRWWLLFREEVFIAGCTVTGLFSFGIPVNTVGKPILIE
jgi:hypothetical protein